MCSTGLHALRAIVVLSRRSQICVCQEVASNSDLFRRRGYPHRGSGIASVMGSDANAESFRYVPRARSAADFERIARDDCQSMVKPLPIEPEVPEL